MDKDTRKQLIKSLVLAKQAKSRKKSMDDILSERDSGRILEPTYTDIEEELNNLSGFRNSVPRTEMEELFYGSSDDATNNTEE